MAEPRSNGGRRQGDPSIRVLLAGHERLFRQVIKAASEAEPDIEVVAETRDGATAAAEASRSSVDVAVVDLAKGDAVRGVAAIVEQAPSCKVLVLSDELDDRVLLDALQAGASGYLSKGASLDALLSGIRSIHAGDIEIPKPMLKPLLHRLMNRWQEQEQVFRRINRLSRREREVLRLLASGAGTTQIAGSLYVSPATVRTHIQNVITKLEVHSRVDVAAFVTRHQVLQNLEWML
jgi:DNA-binding NarL/FixJ family response regulator